MVTASIPGQPGTIEYIAITMGEHMVRFDHGPDLTRLLNKQDGSEIYLDHRFKTWRKRTPKEVDQSQIHFQLQTDLETKCGGQIFKSNQIDKEFGLFLIIELKEGPTENQLMGHLLDVNGLSTYDTQPKGQLPCHIQVVAEEPLLTIALVQQSEVEVGQEYFAIPGHYDEYDP